MIFSRACASRKLHAGQVAETVVGTLVGRDANIALVVVTVRPESLCRREVTWTGKIAHGPKTRPETTNSAFSGEGDTGLEMAALVAQLVPRLNHTRAVIEAMARFSREFEVENTVFGEGLIGVIPLWGVSSAQSQPVLSTTYLQIHSRTIPDINRLKVGIVTVVKGATGSVEFVGKDQNLLLAIGSDARHGLFGRVWVDEACPNILEQRLVLLAGYTQRVVCAWSPYRFCDIFNKGTNDMSVQYGEKI